MSGLLTEREMNLVESAVELTMAKMTKGTVLAKEERQYKVAEAAKLLDGLVGRGTITKWCKQGRIGTRGKGSGKTAPYYVTISEIRRVSGLDRKGK